jgi:hypothetical protein
MKKTVRETNGKEIEIFTAEYLKDEILNPKDEYWIYGSGDVGIYRYDEEISCLILVYCKEANGFFVQLYPKKAPDDWFVAISNSDSNKEVTVYYGGNKYSIPQYVIISPADTWEAVRHYFNFGNTSENVKWMSYWDIDWPLIEE